LTGSCDKALVLAAIPEQNAAANAALNFHCAFAFSAAAMSSAALRIHRTRKIRTTLIISLVDVVSKQPFTPITMKVLKNAMKEGQGGCDEDNKYF